MAWPVHPAADDSHSLRNLTPPSNTILGKYSQFSRFKLDGFRKKYIYLDFRLPSRRVDELILNAELNLLLYFSLFKPKMRK